MARPPALKLWLLLGLVLAGHAATLEWLASHREPASKLLPFVPPMYTRLLQQQTPPAPAPAPAKASVPPAPVSRHSVAARPVPAASTPAPPQPRREEVVSALPPEPAASAAPPAPSEAVAVAPDSPASAPAADPLADWPTDTRLSYRLSGRYRGGELYGDARVQWQRSGSLYQVSVDIDVKPWVTLLMTSQGDVTPQGLLPRAYEEIRPGRKRAATFGDAALALENGKSAPRPEGMQDTASQFVELSHRFASGRDRLEVGQSIGIWLARPGAVDRWTYDVVESEVLQSPQLGPIEAFRLKPRPIANARGNITAEMWFAPSLQYLPVRIKVLMGDEAFVDLLVDRIEQR